MAELKVKPCGWKYKHQPHHIIQLSSDSFDCPGYSALDEIREESEHGG